MQSGPEFAKASNASGISQDRYLNYSAAKIQKLALRSSLVHRVNTSGGTCCVIITSVEVLLKHWYLSTKSARATSQRPQFVTCDHENLKSHTPHTSTHLAMTVH
jgi:hypothetical protein